MEWRTIAGLLVLTWISRVSAQIETCYTTDSDPYVFFASKTDYGFAKDNSNNQAQFVPGCTPVMFWMLSRHGAHLPDPTDMVDLPHLADLQRNVIQNYASNFANINQRMCRNDVENLRNWMWNPRHNLTFAGDLSSSGYLTTQNIARSWKQRYHDLLTDNPKDYMFNYVDDRRSRNSYVAFAEGLFGQRAQDMNIPKGNDDKLLRPYKHCPAWSKEVGESNETISQVKIFTSKQEYKDMISNVSARLGFAYNINERDVERMYEMCRLNKAWEVTKPSPWCAPFTKEDLKRLEYVEDLTYYHKYGYGSPLNQKLGCAPIKDMVSFFSSHVGNPNTNPQPKVKVHMTQGPALLMALTSIGAFQDIAPLTGDNYKLRQAQNRKWRTSFMEPFSANLVAVLYRCQGVGEEFKVLFLENEQPMILEECAVGLCEWSVVKRRFGHVAEKCDLSFCNNSAPTTRSVGLALLMASIALWFINA